MAYTIAEKAIRFRHPDYNPDRAQKLTSSSVSRHLSTRNISSKSMHAFVSNLANRQTERQTNERGQTHLPPPLLEVNKHDWHQGSKISIQNRPSLSIHVYSEAVYFWGVVAISTRTSP